MARSFIECQDEGERTTLEGIKILSMIFEKHKKEEITVEKVMSVLRVALEHGKLSEHDFNWTQHLIHKLLLLFEEIWKKIEENE